MLQKSSEIKGGVTAQLTAPASPIPWLIFRSRDGSKKRDPGAVKKRFFMVLIISIVAFLTLVIIFSQLGRHATDDDPFLDPMNNPNIKVEQKVIGVD